MRLRRWLMVAAWAAWWPFAVIMLLFAVITAIQGANQP